MIDCQYPPDVQCRGFAVQRLAATLQDGGGSTGDRMRAISWPMRVMGMMLNCTGPWSCTLRHRSPSKNAAFPLL